MNGSSSGPGPRDHPHESVLNDLLDGELAPHDEAEARLHLQACGECREIFRAMESLRLEARALPPGLEPPRDLWEGIEARLGGRKEESPAPSYPSRLSPRRGPRVRRTGRSSRWPPISWGPGLAAAAAVAAVAAGSVLFMTEVDRTGEPTAFQSSAFGALGVQEVEQAYRPAIEELRDLVDSRDLSPETRVVLEENLALIDRAIAESREAVEADPGAHRAIESLRRMYDAKIEALRTVAVRN